MTRIGAKFLEIRTRKGLTLEEVAEHTKIKKEFLKAIEQGEFKKLPSSAYAYGFVRNYAKFLGVNPDQAIALFKREFDSDKAFDILPQGVSRKENFNKKRVRIGRNFIAILGIFVFIIAYIFFQYKDAIFNPPLNISSPKENQLIVGSETEVKGVTSTNSAVYVDDELIFVDDFGNFKKTITVFPGKTVIVIKSLNRFGKQTEVNRHINVKPGY